MGGAREHRTGARHVDIGSGPARHIGVVTAPRHPARRAPHPMTLPARSPTHVIAVPVAATHRAAACRNAIGCVGVGARPRGHDVWGDGWAPDWQAARLPFQTALPPCASPNLIRRPEDRRTRRLHASAWMPDCCLTFHASTEAGWFRNAAGHRLLPPIQKAVVHSRVAAKCGPFR